ncbi:MAG: diphthine synthase [Candidatus Micrarchaeota archaeon]|nr:diphthine synthase [Candidatus Micrarchaeota archaeon]
MLALIGMGLGTGDVSAGAIDFMSTASRVYVERYTAVVDQQTINSIAGMIGKEIAELQRADMEDNLKETVKLAKAEDVAILVSGDPLVATTHHIIVDEAASQGIKTRIFHSSSIFSAAIGESGLDIYRFGPPVTIPYWSEKYRPASFLDAIKRNMANNFHTMLLLDINQAEKRPMSLREAIETIQSAQKQSGVDAFGDETRLLIMGDVGKEGQRIIYTALVSAMRLENEFHDKMLAIIAPANPNFAESEAISKFQKV